MENIKNNYATILKSAIAVNPTFKAICDYNENLYQQGWYEKHKNIMANGTGVLNHHEQAITYLAAYGTMHLHKLNLAFTTFFEKENFNNISAEIIDWGCGQAFASCVLIDFIKNNNINFDLSKFTLIEPSSIALQRGIEHIETICQRKPKPQIVSIFDKVNEILSIKYLHSSNKIKIHLFSNLLDINTLELNKVFKNVINNFDGINYFVCVSPINKIRLQHFYKMFSQSILLSSNESNFELEVFRPSEMRKIKKSISRVEYIFKTKL